MGVGAFIQGLAGRAYSLLAGRRPAISAKYDAAQTTAENRRHWAQADQLSAQSSLTPGVRKTIRTRARYEVANNAYAKGITLSLADDLVGTGPRLQLVAKPGTNIERRQLQYIEAEWAEWTRAVDLAGKLRTMRQSKCVDGEAFAMFITNEKLPTPVKLDLRLIEADQIASPQLFAETDKAIDGIEYDAAGNPSRYSLLRSHPGANGFMGTGLEFDYVSADQMIHWYRVDRPGQGRGLSEMTAALGLFANLRRFTLATIRAAEVAANHAAVIYTDTPADDSEQPDAMDTIELERGMATTLPAGWKLGQMQAEQPVTTYSEFTRAIIREIARCMCVPLNIALGDSSLFNYSSARLDAQNYTLKIKVERDECERKIVGAIFSKWIQEAALMTGYLPQFARKFSMPFTVSWIWDGRPFIDPVKEATSQTMLVSAGLKTISDAVAEMHGTDLETFLMKQKSDRDGFTEMGVPYPVASPINVNISETQGASQ